MSDKSKTTPVTETDDEANPEHILDPETLADPDPQITARLRQELEAKELEAKTNYDRFVRQLAELENFKKRTAREREEALRFGNDALIKDLLPVLDNLERALAHASVGGNSQPLVEGVELVLRGFLEALAKHGVVPIDTNKQPFDPSKHEAMAQIESADDEPNTVMQEHQRGYLLRERLLRPALVSVAKAVKTQEKKNQQSKVEITPSDD